MTKGLRIWDNYELRSYRRFRMITFVRTVVCGILILALALPAFANGGAKVKGTSVFGEIGKTGTLVVEQTEGIVTGCLKNCFSLFNPCLDFVKGCTSIVLAPIERPFDYVESKLSKPKAAKKAAKSVPDPKKPELPK